MKPKEEKAITNIEPDVVFKGTFQFKEILKVKGSIQGKVIGKTGQIFIEKDGKIEGDVKAEKVENHGSLIGLGEIKDYTLFADGVSDGQWKFKSIMVEKGALFNGQTQMEK